MPGSVGGSGKRTSRKADTAPRPDPTTFRFNRRRSRHRGLLFYRLIEGAVAADPHPYKTLRAPEAA